MKFWLIFVFNGPQLANKQANIVDSMSEIVFSTGFGCISGVVTGPDGLLYVTSLTDRIIHRIVSQYSPEGIGTNIISPPIIYIVLAAIVVDIIATYVIRRKNPVKK